MSEGKVIQGDCLEVLRGMEDNSVDAVVCDPPYGLSNTTPAQVADTIAKWAGGERDHVPTGRGFMGKSWDAFVPPPAVWDECLRVLKPGGHMVVFAGSRTHDLMGLSIRLAGFEMRDSLAWLYGSGFPKSHDVSKAIDKLAGAEREVTGRTVTPFKVDAAAHRGTSLQGSVNGDFSKQADARGYRYTEHTAPATPEAAKWSGHGTALKPAFEPIVLARKPLAEKTVARNVLEHGTGAINVDACRIGTTGGGTHCGNRDEAGKCKGHANAGRSTSGETFHGAETVAPSGRWPANVVLDEHAAAWVDEQSGHQKDGVAVRRNGGGRQMGSGLIYSDYTDGKSAPDLGYGGAGGASRFFYTAKAPKRERPNVDGIQHPTVKPLAIMQWLIRLVTPPGGTVLDPFAGSGTTIEAAIIEGFAPVGIEMEADYLPLIQHRIDRVTPHPAHASETRHDY